MDLQRWHNELLSFEKDNMGTTASLDANFTEASKELGCSNSDGRHKQLRTVFNWLNEKKLYTAKKILIMQAEIDGLDLGS